MVEFFFKRPVFAWVLAIATMLTGVLAMQTLPVERYPTVAPPAVEIEATFPGASAETVSNTVVQVIEQQMTGIDDLIYMESTGSSAGRASIKLTFEPGTDPDIAQVQVQNKLKQAEPMLPREVQRQGLTTERANSSFLMVTAFLSTDGRLAKEDLADFVASEIREPIGRVQGVGNVQVFGSQYAMRIWLDPEKLQDYELTIDDVRGALEDQNTVVTAGELGGLPAVEGQQLNATVNAQGLLESREDFRDVLLKTTDDGGQVRLGDVAEVELGAESPAVQTFYNEQPASGMGINLAPGANALETSRRVQERLEELEPFFPEGVEVRYPYSTAPFVEASIEQVIHTLVEAVILVVAVMMLFLQSWRATLVPTLAIPVVLLGTFAVMAATGFSINMLTMFGMVLAIGLLVDDAIVVVENVERIMHEEGVGPVEATRRSMRQITGALVGIGVVLSAVFIPMAFFSGSTGAIYRQFSITIVTAMALSVLVALILSPAVCGGVLRRQDQEGAWHQKAFGWFNRLVEAGTRGYVSSVRGILNHPWIGMGAFLAIVGLLAVLFVRVPGGFLPQEDQGVVITQFQLPAGATQERTLETVDEIEEYYLDQPEVNGVFAVAGFSFTGRAQNVGIAFINLKPWAERGPGQDVDALLGRANKELAGIVRDGEVSAFNIPPIPALGNAGGFDLRLQDRGDLGHDALMAAQAKFLAAAAESPVLAGVRPDGLDDNPQYELDIDRDKARALGVPLPALNQLLSTGWGSGYVNDFLHQGRIKRVYLQGEAEHRMVPEDLREWYVRNEADEMVPVNEVVDGGWGYGSPRLERYNSVPARSIAGGPAPGYSTGEAMAEAERIIEEELPDGVGQAWSSLSYQERQAGDQAGMLYLLSLIVVLLALAALYESWTIPFAVVLAVPLGVIGAVVAALLRGIPNDVFFQVGILTTLGLTAKNAILIVEFARDLEGKGLALLDATLEAVRIRLRPILMTSLAFSMGVIPLALASGAGAASQMAIGTAVLGGMVSATFLAIFFIPLFYVVVRRVTDRLKGVPAA
ncbi:efflux RND transporter permease subunit [Thiohalospira sp.]|uniref:efflux RND transporter permease subunit n=1 Tax=Thiohalospira sp. TaxID=3080549 RepID=UPI00397F9545